MGAVVYGVVRSADAGRTDLVTLVTVATGVLLLVAFVVHERAAAQPIMPLRLFADPSRAAAYGARFLLVGAMLGSSSSRPSTSRASSASAPFRPAPRSCRRRW